MTIPKPATKPRQIENPFASVFVGWALFIVFCLIVGGLR